MSIAAPRPGASFATLPTELKLQILRHAVVATPLHISWTDGKMIHPLLDRQLFRIRAAVLDVIFHSAPVQCTVTCIYKWSRIFFKVHDRLHGQEKRLKLRWRIEHCIGDSVEDRKIMRWAAEMGIPAENAETCDRPPGSYAKYGWSPRQCYS